MYIYTYRLLKSGVKTRIHTNFANFHTVLKGKELEAYEWEIKR